MQIWFYTLRCLQLIGWSYLANSTCSSGDRWYVHVAHILAREAVSDLDTEVIDIDHISPSIMSFIMAESQFCNENY